MPRMAARGSTRSSGRTTLCLICDAGGFIGFTVRLNRETRHWPRPDAQPCVHGHGQDTKTRWPSRSTMHQ